MTSSSCRFCGAPLRESFVDLGMAPLSNAFLRAEQLNQMENFFPLHVWVCQKCLLVQLEEFEAPEHIFSSDYAYFSSFSDTWLAHARRYVETMIERFKLGPRTQVMELASNDGYLLQYFLQRGYKVLGIEPAGNVAEAARAKGIETRTVFFGVETARQLVAEGRQADLLVGNNVLAHVPDLNDFVAGMKIALAPGGLITMEFPHLLNLMRLTQFDTIYHEHFSYFSFLTVQQVFRRHALRLFDVETLPTHGGSIRIYGVHADDPRGDTERVTAMLRTEREFGLEKMETYRRFGEQTRRAKREILRFLIEANEAGKRVAGYGAPAKGNTLLNYCGVRSDMLEYTVDRSPEKQGKFLPGTHIPVYEPQKIRETKPDFLMILPWNLKDEVIAQMADIRSWGGKFVIPIPHVEVIA